MRNYARFMTVLAIFIAPLACYLSGCAADSQTNANVAPSTANQVPLIAHSPLKGFNRLTVDVKVCEPGTQTCQTIQNVMVDTGSVGLRLQASALDPTLNLPALTSSDGIALGECYRFGGGNAWGMLSSADVSIGGTTAPSMSVQVVTSDPARQPSDCPSGGATSNGTLGIGISDYDCGLTCKMPEDLTGLGWKNQYFGCSDTACNPIEGIIPTTYQLSNPTAVMDGGIYNGAVIDLPSVPDGGASQATGTLTFGVNTLADNTLSSPTVVPLSSSGHFSTVYDGVTYPSSYIDSGTATYTFPDSSLSRCSGALSFALCVSPTLPASASVHGASGLSYSVDFEIGMYPSSGVAQGAAVAASAASKSFVWGAPFFFGKRVAVVRKTASAANLSQSGALYAWEPSALH